MAAFGGGAPSNNGNGASGAQASPWDLGGLDPVPLMGQVRRVLLAIKTVGITKIRNNIGIIPYSMYIHLTRPSDGITKAKRRDKIVLFYLQEECLDAPDANYFSRNFLDFILQLTDLLH